MVFCVKPGKACISLLDEIKKYSEEKAKFILYLMQSRWMCLNNLVESSLS